MYRKIVHLRADGKDFSVIQSGISATVIPVVATITTDPVILPPKELGSNDAKQCPWCNRYVLKDNRCNYVFACGLDDHDVFHVGEGCGRGFCWICLRKYCGQLYDPITGERKKARTMHDAHCCRSEPDFSEDAYCPGGHNPHCSKRW